MQQTDFPYEIVIHDDASTDRTVEIIQEYVENYPGLFVPIFQTENQYSKKVKPLLKYVFPKAQGKYLAICEGDDYWTDTYKLQKQVRFLEQNPSFALCFHNAQIKSGKTMKEFAVLDEREYSGEEILKKWLIPTASAVIRRSSVVNLTNLSERYMHGDIVLFLTVAETGKIWCINEPMSIYRKHAGGVLYGRTDIPRLKRFIRHHEEISRNFSGKYTMIENVILGRYYLYLAFKYLKARSPRFLIPMFLSLSKDPARFFENFRSILRRKRESVVTQQITLNGE